MSDNTLVEHDDTGSDIDKNQAPQAKTYTQEEFDNHMARMKASISKKYEKTFAELGDIDELKQLKSEHERRSLEDQKKRGEFDKIVSDLAAKKDAEIQKRDAIIKEYTVDLPLINAAAQLRSVNPEQVRALLKSQVRLGEDGAVEIVDDKGQLRYSDNGTPFKVEDLVGDFLARNPHFVQPTPATTQGKTNVGSTPGKIDINKLDMSDPNQRAMYKELRFKK